MEYAIIVAPLTEEDGGGYIGYVPDLVGCMSDGETPAEALANTQLALEEWLETARRRKNFVIPTPGSRAEQIRSDRQAMSEVIAKIAARHDELDQQLDDLRRQVAEIQERLDDSEKWDRFSQIIGTPVAARSGGHGSGRLTRN